MDIGWITQSLSGPFGYAVLFFLVMGLSAVLFLPVPVVLIVTTAAQILDPFWVGVIAGVASAIGELSGYFAGVVGEKALKSHEGKIYEDSKKTFQKWGFWGIVLVTISPVTLIDVMGLMAGALRYGWKKFLLAAMIGKVPRYLIVAYAGKTAVDQSLAFVEDNPLFSVLVVLAVVAALGAYYARERQKFKKNGIKHNI
jgi:membrane protein YqaA with SNARE-associated domain